jgi:hypothetical protein
MRRCKVSGLVKPIFQRKANSLAQRQSVSTVLDRSPLLTIDMGQKLGEDVLVLNEIGIISE